MSPPAALSHETCSYVVLTFNPASPFFNQPSLLQERSEIPAPIVHVSQVGELQDSHIYQVAGSKSEFERVKDQVMASLREQEGVAGVKVLEEPKMRAKRGGEF
jgi:hypothetical protein